MHPPELSELDSGEGKILIVEDHPINQELISALVGNLGHAFDLAADGIEAVEMVRQAATRGGYDLVLMDIQMPRCDGFAATRMIRQAGHSAEDVPIVALTANAFGDDIEKCLEAGMQDHVAKPIDAGKLEACITKWQRGERASAGAGNDDAVARLRPEFDALKTQVHVAARAWLEEPDASGDLQHLNTSLHQLAGVAAMFGDMRIGTLAAQCERYFRNAAPDNLYRPPADNILEPLMELVRATA